MFLGNLGVEGDHPPKMCAGLLLDASSHARSGVDEVKHAALAAIAVQRASKSGGSTTRDVAEAELARRLAERKGAARVGSQGNVRADVQHRHSTTREGDRVQR